MRWQLRQLIRPFGIGVLGIAVGCIAPGCENGAQPALPEGVADRQDSVVSNMPENGIVTQNTATYTPLMSATPFITRGLKNTVAEPADSAVVDDDAEVIGISVEGHYRAYLLTA